MSPAFQRDYLLRLPLPLAQLYSRAHNAKDARGRHDNSYYLCEALVKLSASAAVAAYLSEDRPGTGNDDLDRLLAQLALPSFGQWVAILRGCARWFSERTDAATHPLGHLRQQLELPRRDLPGILELYQRIKNGPDGKRAGDQSVSLFQLFDALVQYRNGVFGHGGPRFDSFFTQEMGPLLLPALNELLAEGTIDPVGPRGSRLVYLTEIRLVDEGKVEVSCRELIGLQGERLAPLVMTKCQAEGLEPNRVAVLWPGRATPLRLDPLLLYRDSDVAAEVLFLNRDRNSRQVEFLSYTTGRTERDNSTVQAMAALLSRVTGREVTQEQLKQLAEQSLAETPSVEALFGAETPRNQVRGDYEVLGMLGRGGMGVVYLARQLSLGRLVALKMLPPDLAGDPVALSRFQREIRHLARCDHPNVVKVLSSGTMPDGQVFYTMEFIPGCDLEQVWRELEPDGMSRSATAMSGSDWARVIVRASRKRREQTAVRQARAAGLTEPTTTETVLGLPPLPELPDAAENPGSYVRRVVQLIRDAALALQAAHDQGIIHRDVKPANLMLTQDGQRIVLMDFGLAKGQSQTGNTSRGAGLVGTLRYAAPEQLAAATLPIGPPVDVRALGVTLWELLTRRRIFSDAEDEAQLAVKVHDEDVPPIRRIDPSLDRDLEAIVARATERGIGDRIQSAGQLAEYLQHYLEGKTLRIRTPSTGELALRWVRRHRPLVMVSAAAVVVLLLGLIRYTGALQKATAISLVNNLLRAETEQVPEIIKEIEPYRLWANHELRRRMDLTEADGKERLHLSLALAPVDPGQFDYLIEHLFVLGPSEAGIIARSLRDHGRGFLPRLWKAADDIEEKPGRRFRAACVLAFIDPSSERWTDAALCRFVAAALIEENTLHVSKWMDLLRPIRVRLNGPLAELFLEKSERRSLIARMLEDFARDDPMTLARVALDADPREYAVLYQHLEAHRTAVIGIMEKKLAQTLPPDWHDRLLDGWPAPDAVLERQFTEAKGMLTDRFALCLTMPVKDLEAVSDQLARSGYRPVCVRPYATGNDVLVSAAWTRDGLEWRLALGVSPRQVQDRDNQLQREGFEPRDVAAYRAGPNFPGDVYAALWIKGEKGVMDSEIHADLPDSKVRQELHQRLEREDFLPRTLGRWEREGRVRHAEVWWKPGRRVEAEARVYDSGRDRAWYETKHTPSRLQTDVRLSGGPSPQHEWSAVWQESPDFISEDAIGANPAQHLERCRELAAKGYRPVSVSTTGRDDGTAGLTASVWHLPVVPETSKDRLARRQAQAAVTLLRLGQAAMVWPLLRHQPDPRLRTYLIHRLAALGTDPLHLVRRLKVELNVSARRALVLALGQYTDEKQWASLRSEPEIVALQEEFLREPDSGLHSAIDWLLRRWKLDEGPRHADGTIKRRDPDPTRRWYVNQQGQTMIVIPGPVTFRMGSAAWELDRYKQEETMHTRHIPRSYSLAAKPITVREFRRFRPRHDFSNKYSPDPDGPIISVTWYEAARYCNWLSGQEQIPETEWCYVTEDNKESVRLADNYLARTGYRLPTEAEWEYACRAETVTTRCYGAGKELLGEYAWFHGNASDGEVGERTWPVGLKKPNDFGLFDMHGNVWQWCGNRYRAYPEVPRGQAAPDEAAGDPEVKDTEEDRLVLRGGSFVNRAPIVRSASRNRYRAATRNYYVGLRVARTVPASPTP